jgi:hypothetical protein
MGSRHSEPGTLESPYTPLAATPTDSYRQAIHEAASICLFKMTITKNSGQSCYCYFYIRKTSCEKSQNACQEKREEETPCTE